MSRMFVIMNSEYGNWSTPAKNGSGKDALTHWMQVQFKKDKEPELKDNKGWINVKDFFLSCYKTKSDNTVPKIVIMDYDYSEPENK